MSMHVNPLSSSSWKTFFLFRLNNGKHINNNNNNKSSASPITKKKSLKPVYRWAERRRSIEINWKNVFPPCEENGEKWKSILWIKQLDSLRATSRALSLQTRTIKTWLKQKFRWKFVWQKNIEGFIMEIEGLLKVVCNAQLEVYHRKWLKSWWSCLREV